MSSSSPARDKDILWYSREKDADWLADQLRAARLTVLQGQSGSGKTVLLRYGVLPRLRRRATDPATTVTAVPIELPAPERIPDDDVLGKRRVVVPFPDRRRNANAGQPARDAEIVVYLDAWQGQPLDALHVALREAIGLPPSPRAGAGELLVEALDAWHRERGLRFLFVLDDFDLCLKASTREEGARSFVDQWVQAVSHPLSPAHFLIAMEEPAEPLWRLLTDHLRTLGHLSDHRLQLAGVSLVPKAVAPPIAASSTVEATSAAYARDDSSDAMGGTTEADSGRETDVPVAEEAAPTPTPTPAQPAARAEAGPEGRPPQQPRVEEERAREAAVQSRSPTQTQTQTQPRPNVDPPQPEPQRRPQPQARPQPVEPSPSSLLRASATVPAPVARMRAGSSKAPEPRRDNEIRPFVTRPDAASAGSALSAASMSVASAPAAPEWAPSASDPPLQLYPEAASAPGDAAFDLSGVTASLHSAVADAGPLETGAARSRQDSARRRRPTASQPAARRWRVPALVLGGLALAAAAAFVAYDRLYQRPLASTGEVIGLTKLTNLINGDAPASGESSSIPAANAALQPASFELVSDAGDSSDDAIVTQLAQLLTTAGHSAPSIRFPFGYAGEVAAMGEQPRLAVFSNDVLQAAHRLPGATPLRIVSPLFTDEIYFVVRSDSPLRYLHQIRSARIDAGPARGARALTANSVYDRLFGRSIPLRQLATSSREDGLERLLTDRSLDVVVLVGAQPDPWLQSQSPERKRSLRLLELDDKHWSTRKLVASYPATTVSQQQGSGLEAPAGTQTISMRTFLTTSASPGDTTPGASDPAVEAATALCRNLPLLQREGHPKWREVQLGGPLDGPWPAAPGVADVLNRCAAR